MSMMMKLRVRSQGGGTDNNRGVSARLISKYRPSCPIICVTRNEQTSRQLHLSRGVYPVHYPEPRGVPSEKWQVDVDNRIRSVLFRLLKSGKIRLYADVSKPEKMRTGRRELYGMLR